MLFVLSGKVIWAVGLVMLAEQILGARMVLARGQQLIRPMIVAVSLLMSIKLIYDNHGAAIAHWLAVWL